MDCSDSPTFGKQEGSAYNGHFGYTCYHSLFVFNQFGDIERALLRNGNVYSSDDWKTSCFFTGSFTQHCQDYLEWKQSIGEPTNENDPLILSS